MATMNFDIASKGDARVAIFLKKCKEAVSYTHPEPTRPY